MKKVILVVLLFGFYACQNKEEKPKEEIGAPKKEKKMVFGQNIGTIMYTNQKDLKNIKNK